MKNLFVSILLSASLTGFSQITIRQSSIAPLGNISSVNSYKMICVSGELSNRENNTNNLHLSEGFIHPQMLATSFCRINNNVNIKIFPNPTRENVNILFGKKGTYNIRIYNIKMAKIFETKTINTKYTNLKLNNLTPGEYFIVIREEKNNKIKTFKLIKE